MILLVPHDIYAPDSSLFAVRWGFWANKVTYHSYPLEPLSITLENCNLFLRPGSASSFDFEVSRAYGVEVTESTNSIEVKVRAR